MLTSCRQIFNGPAFLSGALVRGNIDMAIRAMTASTATTPAVPAQGIGGQDLIAGQRIHVRITALLTGLSMQIVNIGHETMYTLG